METINGVTRTTSYTYDDDNRVTSINTDGISESYSYDSYGRVTTKVTKNGSTTILTEEYTYKTNASGKPTNQVATMRSHGGNWDITHTYEYDANGNITYLGGDSTGGTAYIYDSANQLIRENNGTVGLSWLYSYGDAGNVSQRLMSFCYYTDDYTLLGGEVNYTYEDSSWGDLLTEWNGQTITSDSIGNMLSNGIWTYNWVHGRELSSMTDGSSTWSFTYDANGMRTSRSNGSRTYNYVYNGSSLSQLTVDGHTMRFTYDASGSPLSINYDGTEYYYVLNLQGDVRAILDSSGNRVVTYNYDAWGNLRWMHEGSLQDTLGFYNPLCYRGYVYDAEYKLYYLQSRYYDPEICRFLNADTLVSTGQGLLGNNMFAYCRNNPVTRKDASGTEDVSATDFNQDNNPLNDLGNPSGRGGGGNAGSNGSNGNGSGYPGPNVHQIESQSKKIQGSLTSESQKGWRVGDNISNKTSAGKDPSWTTVRQRYWKNEAHYYSEQYCNNDLLRMRKGLAPKGDDGFSMELHHPYGRLGSNFYYFQKVTHSEHMEIHYGG